MVAKHAEQDVIRFALVGAGRIAQSHLDALTTLPDATLTAVVDVRDNVAAPIVEQHRCRSFTDHRSDDVAELCDAVVICTPPATHHAIAKHFLERGKHVLCEKPLTIDASSAEELVRLAATRRLLLMMASKFRYVDDVIKAKHIIEAGILGELLLFENAFCSKVPMNDRWNAKRAIAGGGVVIDNGSHSVDIARYLMGPLDRVQATLGPNAQKLEVEDTARLDFRTVGGASGHVDLSWSINKELDAYISVYGTSGALHIGWKGSRYRYNGSSSWAAFGGGYDKLAAFRNQHENFIRTLKGQDLPRITAEDALASVRVIEAAYESLGHERWVPVAPVERAA